jgi:hypothetical protein
MAIASSELPSSCRQTSRSWGHDALVTWVTASWIQNRTRSSSGGRRMETRAVAASSRVLTEKCQETIALLKFIKKNNC